MFGVLIPVGGGDPIPLRKEEIIVGRKDSCDIVLRFSNVSSRHCQLTLSNGYWYIEDLKSTNGVKINGKKVTDHRLDPGTKLSISKHDFTIQYDPAKNGATGPPPTEILREGDMFSKSLLEKAGLERPTPKKREDVGSTLLDMPVVIGPAPVEEGPVEKRDFFSELQFD